MQRTTLPVKKNQLFYTLGRDELYVNRNAKSPWQYLTMVSYRQYEKIYDACKRGDGNVECESCIPEYLRIMTLISCSFSLLEAVRSQVDTFANHDHGNVGADSAQERQSEALGE